jgi:hypothetical protein
MEEARFFCFDKPNIFRARSKGEQARGQSNLGSLAINMVHGAESQPLLDHRQADLGARVRIVGPSVNYTS